MVNHIPQATYLAALDLEGLIPILARGGSFGTAWTEGGTGLERGGADLGEVTALCRNLSWPRKPPMPHFVGVMGGSPE